MKVIINNNIFKPILCNTKKSIEEGMMGKNFNPNFDSMLFMMGEEKNQSFWMYNCIIPLDIVMINSENIITKIHSNCEPCSDMYECESYRGIGDKVLELRGGTCESCEIKKGDYVSFSMF